MQSQDAGTSTANASLENHVQCKLCAQPRFFKDEAVATWSAACPDTDVPTDPASQRLWDAPLCRLKRNALVESASSPADRARLLAVGEWESGLWLQVLPSANIGTLLDRSTFRIATSLRLGSPCVVPHLCRCGAFVTNLGHHGLSCTRSAGRITRHHCINDVIRRALASASVPAVLEPSGLARDDGKRPDGMTLVPWKLGRALVWDATCVDTLAPSHIPGTSMQAGAAASTAEALKRRKYDCLSGDLTFAAFGVETQGPWGSGAHHLFKEIAKRLVETTGDRRAGGYFAQRISLAIQRGNAASVLGTFADGDDIGQLNF
ncbi:hypothetical protein evm_011177 [Chilo suppressalis]|nr:hypothetical protein evm_011177 [Chilo suppressalis]